MTCPAKISLLPLIAFTLLAACSHAVEPAKKMEETAKPAPTPAEKAPAAVAPNESASTFKVRFTTSKGVFDVEVHRDWAPRGAARFYELVKAGYYDGARFFRIVPNYVVQFGIAALPANTKKWKKTIKDDPIRHTNSLGTLAFGTENWPDTRAAQVFINLRSNQTLDDQGFAPFARVVEGMSVVEHLYSGYGEKPDQEEITKRGNAYLNAKFPKLDYIKTATIL